MSKDEYRQYLNSEHWQTYRKEELKRANYACEYCEADDKPLHVHHLSYDNLYWEVPAVDTVVLCWQCHAHTHGKLNPRPASD